jgi:iron(III) transport system ATP-binding protein
MLKVEDLRKTFVVEGRAVKAVQGVSFNVEKGQVYTLLGPSGCGKSTILRCVAGLEQPDAGKIQIAGEVVLSVTDRIAIPAYKRNVGMVFQSYAIWPHMNVFDNVAFGLVHRKKKHSKPELRRLVERVLVLVHLEGLEGRSATLLSGGQQQRVALARALVYEPDLLLLDEPLSNLDARLRDEVRKEIKRLVKALNLTILYVTHDQVEALSLSDHISVMRDGIIIQEGSPQDVYGSPQHGFVAKFVGSANQIKGKLAEKGQDGGLCLVDTDLGRLQGTCSEDLSSGDEIVFSVRPDAIMLHTSRPDIATNLIEAEVETITFVGPYTECRLRSGHVHFEVNVRGAVDLMDTQKVFLALPPEFCHVLSQRDWADAASRTDVHSPG